MDKDLEARHVRYLRQAAWTAPLRHKAYQQAGIKPGDRILEVGCGTGVILGDLPAIASCLAVGIDIDPEISLFAHKIHPELDIAAADGLTLPFPAASFDHCLCHFLLLWATNPLGILREMWRVTRHGGFVMALAEPDYAGRIDYPPALEHLGRLQRHALQQAGADPDFGRKLLHFFNQAGLQSPVIGVLGGEWPQPDRQADQANEWEVLVEDLQTMSPPTDPQWLSGPARKAFFSPSKLTYVPTFYAIGYRGRDHE
jgi:SAM-dependent methyltransferase